MPTTAVSAQEAFVLAGIELFGARGIDAPSIQDVCERAGYSRGAFYAHFKNRDALLVAVMDHLVSTLYRDVFGTGGAQSLPTLVWNYAGAMLRATAWPFHRTLEACVRNDEVRVSYLAAVNHVRDQIVQRMTELQRDGSVRSDLAPEALTELVLGLVYGLRAGTELGTKMDPLAVGTVLVRLLAAPASA